MRRVCLSPPAVSTDKVVRNERSYPTRRAVPPNELGQILVMEGGMCIQIE